jgi:hypothetical protein
MLAETICSAVSVAGLGIAAITAFRRRFLTAARIAAYSLIPLGLVLTGAVEWAARTAFSPTAWVGFGLLGGAWLLFLLTRFVERRRGRRAGTEPAAGRRSATEAAQRPQVGRAAPRAGGRDASGSLPPARGRPEGRERRPGRLQRHRGDPEEARHLRPAEGDAHMIRPPRLVIMPRRAPGPNRS